MKYVLTLVGKPLREDDVAEALAIVGDGATPDWLARDEAADILFAANPEKIERDVAEALEGRPIDAVAQPIAGRRRKLLLADMDSTIITVECIDEMADMLGLKAEIAAITARAMAGELDFAEALKGRVAMLAGLAESDLQRVFDERIRLTAGARSLIMTMRAGGAYTVLISGGFSFFTERVAEAAGFERNIANRLGIAEGRLDGTLGEPLIDANAKLATLRKLAAERGLAPADVLAVGDGANDRAMVEAAGLGVAFHAKPILAEAARARIDHGDLGALLYLQGYRAGEFVT